MKKATFNTRKTVNLSAMNEGEKITATCSTLNTIVCFANEAMERYEQLGLHALAGEAEQIAQDIRKALDACGFYED